MKCQATSLAAMIALLGAIPPHPAMGDALWTTVQAALRQQPQTLTPLRIEWVESVQTPSDAAPVVQRTNSLSLGAHGRIASRSRAEGGEDVGVLIFDGKTVLSSTHDIASAQHLDQFTGTISFGFLFDAIGYRPPADKAELAALHGQSDLLEAFTGDGLEVSSDTLDGRPVVRLRIAHANEWRDRAEHADLDQVEQNARSSPGSTEESAHRVRQNVERMRAMPATIIQTVWLDPAYGFNAVRREWRFDDGRLSRAILARDFERVGERATWLPHTTEDDIYWSAATSVAVSGTPVRRQFTRVLSVGDTILSDADFVLPNSSRQEIIADMREQTDARPEDRVVTRREPTSLLGLSVATAAWCSAFLLALLCVLAVAFHRRENDARRTPR